MQVAIGKLATRTPVPPRRHARLLPSRLPCWWRRRWSGRWMLRSRTGWGMPLRRPTVTAAIWVSKCAEPMSEALPPRSYGSDPAAGRSAVTGNPRLHGLRVNRRILGRRGRRTSCRISDLSLKKGAIVHTVKEILTSRRTAPPRPSRIAVSADCMLVSPAPDPSLLRPILVMATRIAQSEKRVGAGRVIRG